MSEPGFYPLHEGRRYFCSHWNGDPEIEMVVASQRYTIGDKLWQDNFRYFVLAEHNDHDVWRLYEVPANTKGAIFCGEFPDFGSGYAAIRMLV